MKLSKDFNGTADFETDSSEGNYFIDYNLNFGGKRIWYFLNLLKF